VSRETRILFATDLHGSSKCFRKFINAAPIYRVDVLVLGGDLAGKAIQTIVRQPRGRWSCRFIGVDYSVEDGPDLDALERLIEDHGYYPYRAEPGEVEAIEADAGVEPLFLRLMEERLTAWLALADARLRSTNTPLFLMLGNDDPVSLRPLLDAAPWGTHAEGRVVMLDERHEMMSWGYSNITPWHSHREQTEEQLADSLHRMAIDLSDPASAVVNVHVPPYGTQLDDAPVLDSELRVVQVMGQVKFAAVGSTAVREFLLETQPLLGLHGHIHESAGIRRLGRTIAINPGSDYATGALHGALVTLKDGRVTAHQLVRG
jgi:Icc-related predicted phosphoesterase